jgi:hypothetical protein
MIDPTIKIELTLHPEARDGQPNAWKIEMRDSNGQPLFIETGDTAAACLDRASNYMACGGDMTRTYVVPFDVPTLFHRVRGLFRERKTYFDGYQLRDAGTKRSL